MKYFVFRFEKLCRDKTIERLESWKARAEWVRLDDTTYAQELRNKLREETEEVCTADHENLIAELADVLEVIDALCAFHRISHNQLIATQTERRNERGGFYDRIYITKVHTPEGSFPEKYYRADPSKYPEIKE